LHKLQNRWNANAGNRQRWQDGADNENYIQVLQLQSRHKNSGAVMMWCSNSPANGAEPSLKPPMVAEIRVGMKGAGKSAKLLPHRKTTRNVCGTTEPGMQNTESQDSASFAEKNFLLALEGKSSVATIADGYTVGTSGQKGTGR
jgi:hypothetical protein